MKITITKEQLEKGYQRKIDYILLEDGTRIEPTKITLEIPDSQDEQAEKCNGRCGPNCSDEQVDKDEPCACGCGGKVNCEYKSPELPEELEGDYEGKALYEIVIENQKVINSIIQYLKAKE